MDDEFDVKDPRPKDSRHGGSIRDRLQRKILKTVVEFYHGGVFSQDRRPNLILVDGESRKLLPLERRREVVRSDRAGNCQAAETLDPTRRLITQIRMCIVAFFPLLLMTGCYSSNSSTSEALDVLHSCH